MYTWNLLKILTIGASSEDIAFGCGGILLKYAALGHQVSLCTITICGTFDYSGSEALGRCIGARNVMVGDFQNATHNVTSELIAFLESCITSCDPDLILTPFRSDVRHDCEAIATATLEAGRFYSNILSYETPSAKNFYPKVYVDISDTMQKKEELAKACCKNDTASAEHLRGLAEFRALQSRLNTKMRYVEGFEVMKLCIDEDFKLQKLPRAVQLVMATARTIGQRPAVVKAPS